MRKPSKQAVDETVGLVPAQRQLRGVKPRKEPHRAMKAKNLSRGRR